MFDNRETLTHIVNFGVHLVQLLAHGRNFFHVFEDGFQLRTQDLAQHFFSFIVI